MRHRRSRRFACTEWVCDAAAWRGSGARGASLFAGVNGSANLKSQPRSAGRTPGGGEWEVKQPGKQ